jgi:hypothetical protein
MNPRDFENDEPSDAAKAAELAITALASRTQTILSIEAGLREQMPEVMEALEEARAEVPGLQEAAKVACRLLGPGLHLVGGHAVQVKNAAQSTTVDSAGLIERATESNELDELIKLGVLRYEVVPHQIARLPAKQRVRYETYIQTKTGTASVSLPPELK